ncbi:MAG TPA: N-acetylglutaminylglutamine amidotransferase [Alphaproteobacteria bacterium]
MCGICGEITFGPPALAKTVAAMNNHQNDRGPDACGMFLQDRVGFGHRRLSILDTEPTSNQPMIDSELGLAIVFNGCIYNFRELRRELLGKGYRFFSDGDTEVILKAYKEWGARCVDRFHGMFAFVIWERDTGRTVLVRDRLGIKPLYIADDGKRLRFASTLPALLAAGGVDTQIDPIGLHNYMSLHAVVVPPRTILKGVKKLPPATILTIDADGTRRQETYWTLSMGPKAPQDRTMSKEEWQEAVLDALTTSIKRRQVADVPVGVLLSGGLDSSLVVALLAESGQTDLKTFAIGFESVGNLKGDEFKYSDFVAKHFGTQHERIEIKSDATLDALPGAIQAMSEPMMSHDAVGFYLLSEQVSKRVKVVQSGQGADEVFGGYHWYPKMLGSNDPAADYARVYFDRDHAEMSETLAPEYLGEDYSRKFVEDFFEREQGSHPIDATLQLDTEVMLVDDPVKRVDNMTMAWGLEARVPFLDHELVELAARIPAELKVRDGGKYILKEAARSVVPKEIIDRPKGYFPVPALKYIRGPFLKFAKEVLDRPVARGRGLFKREYIDRLLGNPEGELTPKGHSKLWQIVLLESWLQAHNL